MNIESVADALQAINTLKGAVPPAVFAEAEAKINAAFEELMGVKASINEPLPTDASGQITFRSLDDAISRYVNERDQLKLAMSIAKKVEDEAKDRMSKISMWLRDKGDELGVDSFKTQYGTAYRSVKTSFRMGDWNSFVGWIKETGNFQCLEKRVAKLATKEIYDETGTLPPGIEYVAEVEFDVRRPTRSGRSD